MYFNFVLVTLCLVNVRAYKFLLVNPLPIRSLNILGVGYVKLLLNAGHEVTYLTPFPMKKPPEKSYRQIDMSTHLNIFAGDKFFDIGYLMQRPFTEEADIDYLQDMGRILAEATFSLNETRKLLDDPNEHFDAIIADFFETELYGALAEYYNCPMIWAYSLGAHWTTVQLIDEPTSTALGTDYLTPDLPPFRDMSMRLKKLWARIKWNLNKWYKTKPLEKAFYEKYFGPLFSKRNKPLPDYDIVIQNGAIVIANDFVGNGPTPSLPQNFKFVGGYHIEMPPKPLSPELQTFADNAEKGLIYFSMGSGWKSKDIPQHVTKDLLQLFGSLNVSVLWKFEEDLKNVPRNVHAVKWAPQQSILAHPKCLFFISHGGLLSTLESVHFGVPTIGIPVYYDQFINVNRAVAAGRSIKVDLTLNMVKDLNEAIQKMLRNHAAYKENAVKLSQIYHDRPVSPGKELVHWVEHVVRTGGAPHLRSPASMMPWYQKMFLDVILLCSPILFLIYYAIRRSCPKKVVRNEGGWTSKGKKSILVSVETSLKEASRLAPARWSEDIKVTALETYEYLSKPE